MMRTFMDEVNYNTRGNEVTMIKRRKALPANVLDVIADAIAEIPLEHAVRA